MKNLMLIMLLAGMVLLAGCVAVKYEHKFVSGETLKVNYNNANIKLMDEGLKITLADGSTMELGRREQYPDPNSAKAIGEAIGLGVGAAIMGGVK